MPRTSCSHQNCRLRTLAAALLAALALASLAGLDAAHAQRAQKNANAAQQKKTATTKRVFVGAGSNSGGGTRQTIKSDNPLNDYSAYRSGDRFNVVIPNADANAIAKGGAGRGYSDMQVQQRGKDVVLTYKLQPGAKPRVEQKFNRLDVVFETPEGAPTKTAQSQPNPSTNDARATSAQQNQTATRNAPTASPSSTNNAASNRTPTASTQSANAPQHAAHQQQPATTQPATATPASELQTNVPTTATTNTNAPPEATQGPPDAAPAELELAQARQPEPASPATRTNAPAAAAAPTLGATILRNWPIALILALLVGGLGLFFAARRTSATTRTPPPIEELKPAAATEKNRPAVIEKTEPATVERAKPLTLAEATPPLTTEATQPTVAPSVPVVLVAAKEAGKTQQEKQRARRSKKKGKAKQKPEAPAVAAKQEPPAVVSKDAPAATPLVETPAPVVPLVAASALAGATAATEESVDEETKAAPPAEVAETRPTEETLTHEPIVADTRVEEAAVAETVVEEAAAEKSAVEEAAADETVVEEATVEVAAVDETAIEETVVEETAAEETVVESAAVGDTVVDEAAAVGTAADETVVEEAADESSAVEPSTVEPLTVERSSQEPSLVESSSVELSPVEHSLVESSTAAPLAEDVAEDVVAEAAEVSAPPAAEAVTAIEAALPTADAESVQAETKRLLDGERYDRGVLKAADMMARQMVAAELLSALSGRNAERRWRARTAFIEHGFFNESAHDLHYAEAPAERAAAARALALAGDRAATSHLTAALEDKDINVRRAVVEALASLRDPAAVAPLEELRERQKKHKEKLPRHLLQHAIETCREGDAVASAPPVVETAAVDSATAEIAPFETAGVETRAAEEAATTEPAVAESPVAPAIETARVEETFAAPVEALTEEAVEAPVASAEERAGVAEETEPVIEDAAAWFSIVSAGDAAAVEETKADEPTVAAFDETAVVEAREETYVEKSLAPVVADEAGAPAHAVVEEASAFDVVSASPSAETETVTSAESEAGAAVESKEVEPVIEDAAAWFDLVSSGGAAAVEETRGEDAYAAAEPRPYEPEAPTVVGQSEAPTAWGVESEAATLDGFDMPVEVGAKAVEPASPAAQSSLGAATEDWIELDVEETTFAPASPPAAEAPPAPPEDRTAYNFAPTEIEARAPMQPPAATANRFARQADAPPRVAEEKGVELFDELSTVPKAIQQRITSADTSDRASALADLSRLDTDEAFHQICAGFDDDSREVRNAAARALFDLRPDRADSFTRALRESTPERRRNIGAAINNSGLAADAVGQLTGESRDKTYEAFSLLFLMAKAGEVQPLLRAIEAHPSSEVRLAVVKLLALSGQKEILPAFRRLAVRGSLPTEVRSAVMEAIYQISSQDAHSAA